MLLKSPEKTSSPGESLELRRLDQPDLSHLSNSGIRYRVTLRLSHLQLALQLLHPGFIQRIENQAETSQQETSGRNDSKQEQNAM